MFQLLRLIKKLAPSVCNLVIFEPNIFFSAWKPLSGFLPRIFTSEGSAKDDSLDEYSRHDWKLLSWLRTTWWDISWIRITNLYPEFEMVSLNTFFESITIDLFIRVTPWFPSEHLVIKVLCKISTIFSRKFSSEFTFKYGEKVSFIFWQHKMFVINWMLASSSSNTIRFSCFNNNNSAMVEKDSTFSCES